MNWTPKTVFLAALLTLGLLVEGSNLAELFFEFMKTYRPNWYELFNHLAAVGFSSFWLLTIVFTGIYGEKLHSWAVAVLCMLVSLYVYKDIAAFSLSNFELTHRHTVVLLQSVVLPYFVAFYTHKFSIEMGYRKPTKQEMLMGYMNEAYQLLKFQEDMQRQGMKHIGEIIPQVLPQKPTEPTIQQPVTTEKPQAATQTEQEDVNIFELLDQRKKN